MNPLNEQNMRALQIKFYQVVPAQWSLPSLFWVYFIPSPQVNIIGKFYNKYYGFHGCCPFYSLLWSNGAYKLAVNYSVKYLVRLSNGVGYEWHTVYPKIYARGFVVLCFVVVMQSFIMNSHEVFIHIHQGCFAGTGAIVRLPQCQWSKPDGYGKISQCITTTKHSKAKTVCIFLGIYCRCLVCVLCYN